MSLNFLGELILDMASHPDHEIIYQFYMKNLKNDFKGLTIKPPNLVRYRVPLSEVLKDDPEPYRIPLVPAEGRDHEVLSPGVEGPCINYQKYNGKPYNFVWGVSEIYNVYRPRYIAMILLVSLFR